MMQGQPTSSATSTLMRSASEISACPSPRPANRRSTAIRTSNGWDPRHFNSETRESNNDVLHGSSDDGPVAWVVLSMRQKAALPLVGAVSGGHASLGPIAGIPRRNSGGKTGQTVDLWW